MDFQNLWNKHPTIVGDSVPCSTDGKANFSDQCAIRLGVALASIGVDTTSLVPKARHCWYHDSGLGHVLAAEELAQGLSRMPISGVSRLRKQILSSSLENFQVKKALYSLKTFGLGMVRTFGIEVAITQTYGMAQGSQIGKLGL